MDEVLTDNPIDETIDSNSEKIDDEFLLNQKSMLDQREQELNVRELKADFRDDIVLQLKALEFDITQDLCDMLSKLIDYSNRDAYESSYENLLDVLKGLKTTAHKHSYAPRYGKITTEDTIKEAFKPPKYY